TILAVEHNNKKINFIDVPGADDFIGQVLPAMQTVETGLMLINAQNGVEVGTEIHSRFAEQHNLPLIFIINQLDHEKANFTNNIESLKQRFGSNVIVAQYPVNSGHNFDSIIDIITMKMYKFSDDGKKVEITEIPDSEIDKAKSYQQELIEKAAENDEALMESYFEKDTLTEDELRSGMHTGIITREMFPVFCISSKLNVGISRILDFITNVLPSPLEAKPKKNIKGESIKPDSNGKVSLFIFKTGYEEHIGKINYFKVISGTVNENQDLINVSFNRSKERFAQLFVVNGKNRVKVPSLMAGDIGATVKIKTTKTNNTVNESGVDWEFPKIEMPQSKYSIAIKTVNDGEEEKLGEALQEIQDEDLSLEVEYSKELKQIILHGQGEYHIQTMVKWHLDNIFKIEAVLYPAKIPYRETITKTAYASYRHKKQSGGAGQFGEVHMIIEPYVENMSLPSSYKIDGKEFKISVRDTQVISLDWGGKLVYLNCIVGGVIDAKFLPAILKGIMEKMEDGPLTGSYARDIRVAIFDGKMHPVDSNEISFKLAGRNAFKEAFKKAGPKILEPIYLMEILAPTDRMGDVISDLQTRRAILQGTSSENGFEKIIAKVPLAETSNYSTALKSVTGGRATFTMKFEEYAPVPGDIQQKLLKEYEEIAEEA
ncbi:MAG TPA: elongation factor G, partial [Bacteroidales bacterium]|nr:elongation factor G [Bacteroidales bacterium]